LPGLPGKEDVMRRAFLEVASWAFLLLLPLLIWPQAQEPKTIKPNEPNKKRGLPVMEALSVRASAREWSDQELSLQDLSDLLWAANGINRPEIKKRTAASAMNAQNVNIYVFRKDGAYLYDASRHALNLVAADDFRSDIMMARTGS
jgi:Nitroreductase family